MVIATNMTALNTRRVLNITSNNIATSSEKLSSGYKINRAADDAAGLSISEKMRGQIRGLDRASRNAEDGISMIQVAEGALAEVTAMIQRIRELTVQGANDTNVTEDRRSMAEEVFALSREIWQTEERVEFNTMKILKTIEGKPGEGEKNPQSLDGKFLQVGANANQGVTIDLDLGNVKTPYDLERVSLLYATHSMLNHSGLALTARHGNNEVAKSSYNYTGDDSLNGDLKYTVNHNITGLNQTEWISFMIGNVDTCLENINGIRANLGAMQNRLEHARKNIDVGSENLTAAESRIRDTDMAKEMTELSKHNILQQAGQSMLAQANQAPSSILTLLR